MINGESNTCTSCNRSYVRLEHLQRHIIVAHTSSRLYECSTCGKRYARSDVLKRHSTSCTRATEDRPRRYKVGRPAGLKSACILCARQKRRCSRGQPCQNCAKSNKDCIYSSSNNLEALEKDVIPTESDVCSESALGLPGDDICNNEDVGVNKNAVHPGSETRSQQLVQLSHSDRTNGKNWHWEARLQDWQRGLSYSTPQSNILVAPGISKPLHLDLEPAVSLDWLFNFTKADGIIDSFGTGELISELRIVPMRLQYLGEGNTSIGDCGPDLHREIAHSPFLSTHGDTSIRNLLSTSVYVTTTNGLEFLDDKDEQEHFSNTFECNDQRLDISSRSINGSEWDIDPLSAKSTEIILAIKAKALGQSLNNIFLFDWNSATERLCAEFFSPTNLRAFLNIYWTVWYPNWPVIHKPTFDALNASMQLLAAMAIVGACHSPNAEDRYNMRLWFDVIEEIVFDELTASASSSEFCQYDASRNIRRKRVQAIQAAYAVCIYQNWEGTSVGRRRMRHNRFSTIVSASRGLGFAQAMHQDLRMLSKDTFVWRDFVETEEMIRILIWVFLIDCAFVLFNNIPPRIALRELQMGLACPEACFQAETAEKCLNVLEQWISQTRRYGQPSLFSLIRSICKDKLDEESLGWFAHLGFINLWSVVNAFHVMIFNLEPELGSELQFQPILNGISNWKSVWNRRLLNRDEEQFDVTITSSFYQTDQLQQKEHSFSPNSRAKWKRPGFWRHASEYWLLSRIFVERMISSCRSLEAADTLSGLDGLHSRVSIHVHGSCEEACLKRLNEFIASVQGLKVRY